MLKRKLSLSRCADHIGVYEVLNNQGKIVGLIKANGTYKDPDYYIHADNDRAFESPEKAFDFFCKKYREDRCGMDEGSKSYIWNGTLYSRPSNDELLQMAKNCVELTPVGDEVEPGHPDSWLTLLNIN